MEGRMFEVRSVDVSLMNPAPYNPRVDLKPTDEEYRHIRNSVQRFGYLSPIVWNERTGNIVSGHQRFKVLLEQGATSIDCCVVDFDEEKEKACNLAMNKAQGLWDEAKLDILLDELKATDWAMEDFGFDLSSDEDLYEVDEVEDDGFDAQDAAEEVVEPITKSGDIWLLGRHRLMCGDSTDIESVQALMDGSLADMCITDPPYNVAVENSKGKRIMNDDMEDSSFSAFLDKAFACISANLRKGGGCSTSGTGTRRTWRSGRTARRTAYPSRSASYGSRTPSSSAVRTTSGGMSPASTDGRKVPRTTSWTTGPRTPFLRTRWM